MGARVLPVLFALLACDGGTEVDAAPAPIEDASVAIAPTVPAPLEAATAEATPPVALPATPTAPPPVPASPVAPPPVTPPPIEPAPEPEPPVDVEGIRVPPEILALQPPACKRAPDPARLDAARDHWTKLDPTVADFDAVIASLPEDKAMRSALATVLLPTPEDIANERWCMPEIDEDDEHVLPELAPDTKLRASACARRALLLRMVPHIDACDMRSSETALRHLLLRGFSTEPDLADALAKRGARIGARLWSLGLAVEEPDSFGHALVEHVIRKLAKLSASELDPMLLRFAKSANCRLALEAALALDKHGDSSMLPRSRMGGPIDDAFDALCMTATARKRAPDPIDTLWRTLLTDEGYLVRTDCSEYPTDRDSRDQHGRCKATTGETRHDPPKHDFDHTAECGDPDARGWVTCSSFRGKENTGVASRQTDQRFVFAPRDGGGWRLAELVRFTIVTDEY